MDKGEQLGADNQGQAGWVFKPGDATNAPQSRQPEPPQPQPSPAQPSSPEGRQATEDSVEWTASEFIEHEKNFGWYALWFLAAIFIAAVVYLVTRDVLSTGIILFGAVVFAMAGARKPRLLAYRLDQSGLTVGQKFHPYAEFRSFAVVQQGPVASVVLVPLKRLMPPTDMYIPPDGADKIMEVLSANLPMEPRKANWIDSFARKIRF